MHGLVKTSSLNSVNIDALLPWTFLLPAVSISIVFLLAGACALSRDPDRADRAFKVVNAILKTVAEILRTWRRR